jgi:hypothetical protein
MKWRILKVSAVVSAVLSVADGVRVFVGGLHGLATVVELAVLWDITLWLWVVILLAGLWNKHMND